MLSDLERQMLKLNEAASSDPEGRVWLWRQVLTEVWMDGFNRGRAAEERDARVAARIERAEAAQAEEAGR